MVIMWFIVVIVLLLCGNIQAFHVTRIGGKREERSASLGRRWHRVYAVENEPTTKVGSTSTARTPKKVVKAKAKEPETPNIVMYNKYDNVPQWKLSDSFNSTTLKLIFDFRVSYFDLPVVALRLLSSLWPIHLSFCM